MYLKLFGQKPVISEMHLGGGTPTFFSPEHLTELLKSILQEAEVHSEAEFSIEVHPNYTQTQHLKALSDLRFNRISIGVQDFDPEVQYVINRIQSFEQTEKVVREAREFGFSSVNIDLVYGLPRQKVSSVEHTVNKICELKPDRIAFYSYAHVPWKSKVQRRYSDADIPPAEEKWAMYQKGREMLVDAGYKVIGMDHFALPEDKLFTSMHSGNLHRNFMGYTTTNDKLLIGLGASSIGDAWNAFAQNEKDVDLYSQTVQAGKLPIVNGHLLNQDDLIIRQMILDLMCRHSCSLENLPGDDEFHSAVNKKMEGFETEGLLTREGNQISIIEKGQMFVRLICAALDIKLWNHKTEDSLFSKAI